MRAVQTSTDAVRAGVYGASGTTGAELVSLLAKHPKCALTFATSRTHAGRSLREIEASADDVTLSHPDHVVLDEVDVVFTCLPHGSSAGVVQRTWSAGVRVIDLSGDLRLSDPSVHGRIYGTERDPRLIDVSEYGLTELAREEVSNARVVANPGCYPTCSILALAPLASRGLLEGPVVINALSGVSGAGRSASPATHFCAVAGDVRPYRLGREHRHTPEVEQTLTRLLPTGAELPDLVFCPHVIPIERGMLVTATVSAPPLTMPELHEIYEESYGSEPFVEVLPAGAPARIRAVARSNRAVIGLHPAHGRERRLVITCAIDNLLKGAAGQAVQNMNLMFGLPEAAGLEGASA